jgi:hypothetical protein
MNPSPRGEAAEVQPVNHRHRTSSPSASEFARPGPRSAVGALLAALPLVLLVGAAFAPEIAVGAAVGLAVGLATVPAALYVRRSLRRRRRRTERRSATH